MVQIRQCGTYIAWPAPIIERAIIVELSSCLKPGVFIQYRCFFLVKVVQVLEVTVILQRKNSSWLNVISIAENVLFTTYTKANGDRQNICKQGQ
jgi:hypothetical protein